MADIYYLPEKAFAAVRQKVSEGKALTKEDVEPLANPMDAEDDTIMIPVDMRGACVAFDDVDEMIAKLGPKRAVEAFVKAREYFEQNKGNEGEGRAEPMTGRELKSMMMSMEDEDEEEEEEGEEEVEPSVKKAKTK
mmetsp:Transcript_31741/g.73667  ORF Transcript_31741/g.73667 Transcript_31741/m.73667 type:complete len:136 (-) Transcript_31741:135-542(-)